MNSMNIRYQILTTLCMSNSVFTPTEVLEATKLMYDYLTDGVDMKDEKTSAKVSSIFEVVQ
jgi:hypothetical protein